MKISLSSDLERLIAEKVSSGRYHSADDVVREGLELLQERENDARRSTPSGAAGLAAAFDNISGAVPEEDWASVPADLSKNVDHYLYAGELYRSVENADNTRKGQELFSTRQHRP